MASAFTTFTPRQDDTLTQGMRAAALVLFGAIPLTGFLARPVAGRPIWNLVSLLPLIVVLLGYHRWRRVCPLYALTHLAALPYPRRRRRAPRWLETNYYYCCFALFVGSVWLRLTIMSSDGYAVGLYFLGLSATAVIVSSIFTGRTWCNYLCPVSFIEKLYTETNYVGKMSDSRCSPCTACKRACPDINQENAYWKEISLQAKKIVYFSFPGVVVGFYLYAYLQSGRWGYLLGRGGIQQPGLMRSAFLPGYSPATAGFFFLPELPRAAAAAITLAACCIGSLAIFSFGERSLQRTLPASPPGVAGWTARHLLFSVGACIAFVSFYVFAGLAIATSTPRAAAAVGTCLVVLATGFLLRRIRRARQTDALSSKPRSARPLSAPLPLVDRPKLNDRGRVIDEDSVLAAGRAGVARGG